LPSIVIGYFYSTKVGGCNIFDAASPCIRRRIAAHRTLRPPGEVCV